ncbi:MULTISPECIES: site-specific recombinase [unclassified Neisseria]|uniref:site-specific recombinase n=1 Tax=unclassified Neisseria TaxID=2623750 RepID=UPI0026665FC8|nr:MULTISPECIES: recombinase [unclassified Neisseria]MDO1509170.1 recombinase [Neisseria sp. MVDL19-042950]MDO1515551.1 recombinase [Neisseria sp. MVDL18-041461]MDO1562910.1 recombinase [Neisseria sp. MVDL20-010259]
MKKITPQSLHTLLAESLETTDFVTILNAIIDFLRKGGVRHASGRLDMLLHTLERDKTLCGTFGSRFYAWLTKVHIYPALVGLGIFSRSGFSRELGIRLYERFSPSYKDLNNLQDVFLHLFRSQNDEKWLQSIHLRQWLNLHQLLLAHADPNIVQSASRQLTQERLHALEMLSVWVAAEELEPSLIRIEPRLLDVDSPFVALKRETAKLVEHYQTETSLYDTAHIEVMLDQCRNQVERLQRKGTGAGSGSSVKVAHLLERLSQTLERLSLLLEIQTRPEDQRRLAIKLMNSMVIAAVEQHSTTLLRRRSIKMLAKSISENKSGHGEHYITRTRKEYWAMLRSAAGGGVLIALMALNKIHIGGMGFGEFATSLLNGLNYGIGFMLIHMLHFTVATKQPAMTAASFAEQVERNEKGRVVELKLSKLLVDVFRSQSVAVFGNVSVAVLLAALIAVVYATQTAQPLLDADNVAYQIKSVEPFTQPTLWYAAIAGVWLFCSGIIAGFFDNRAAYLDLRRRLTVNPFLKKFLPAAARTRFAEYMHANYGSLAGNFVFGMLLGMTGYFGHLLNLPLDIRHVAFSSANIGYAAVSGHIGVLSFFVNLANVLLIGLVNLWVSFMLALFVALRARDTSIDSIPKLIKSIWQQIKANPLSLIFPVQTAAQTIKTAKADEKEKDDKK